MRSRFNDGVMIVLLGLTVLTAAIRALPTPPDMRTASMDRGHRPVIKHLGGTGRSALRLEAAAP